MEKTRNEEALLIHKQLRAIMQEFGNEEYGDSIIDRICTLFNHPTTTDKFILADEVVEKLTEYGVDGETMEYIIERVGMTNQMLRQLIMKNDVIYVMDIVGERLNLIKS